MAMGTFERRCEDCDGTGLFRLDDSTPEEKCELCDGTGFAATPLGREVLELVRHNLRNILEELERPCD